jgi:hypothetical protein
MEKATLQTQHGLLTEVQHSYLTPGTRQNEAQAPYQRIRQRPGGEQHSPAPAAAPPAAILQAIATTRSEEGRTATLVRLSVLIGSWAPALLLKPVQGREAGRCTAGAAGRQAPASNSVASMASRLFTSCTCAAVACVLCHTRCCRHMHMRTLRLEHDRSIRHLLPQQVRAGLPTRSASCMFAGWRRREQRTLP